MARGSWYRLDNVGKFYSAQAGRTNQTVFRYAARMSQDVDPQALQAALNEAVAVFPGFNVHLRTGMFWHYLEQAEEPVPVTAENLPICAPLHAGRQSVLFRVSYYRDHINFEVSHIVSDGRGSLAFFRELLCAYVRARYGADARTEYDGSLGERSEDAFSKHYDPSAARSGRSRRPFRLHGARDLEEPVFLEYHLPLAPVRAKAKELQVGFTALVIAVAVRACAQGVRTSEKHRTIRVGVPVDLRSAFRSSTTRNFFGMAFVEWRADDPDAPIEKIARSVDAQLRQATRPEALKERMNQMIKLEKSPFLRLAPVFVKDLTLNLSNVLADRDVTTTVSNVGAIDLPASVRPYVRELDILTSTTGLNFILCSFQDELSVGISTVIRSTDVPRDFVRTFSSWGIHGRVDCSRALDPAPQVLETGSVPEADRAADEAQEEEKGQVLQTASFSPAPGATTEGPEASQGEPFSPALVATTEEPQAPDVPAEGGRP